MVFGLVAGYQYSQRLQCEKAFADYKAQVARDAAQSAVNTVNIVRTLTKKYEAALAEKRKILSVTEAQYNQAMELIHIEGKKNEEYRRWAEQRLPAGVVKRLRELPKTRSKN